MKRKLLSILLTLCLAFSLLPTAALADGANVAKVDGVGYTTLQAAIDAAKDGDTITLLKSGNGDGIVVPEGKFNDKGVTVNFNGYTYMVGGQLVGSSGTGTNAFQLLKGNKLTFKNGSIVGATEGSRPADDTPDWHGAPAMVIQNYCDLTLDNMVISGGDETVYTMSNNCGNVVIRDTTINVGEAKGVSRLPYAFDVYGGFGKYSDITVTVEGTSVINGNIEIDHGDSNDNVNTLVIKAGTVNGTIQKTNGNLTITGGIFSTDVTDYVADGYTTAEIGGKKVVVTSTAEAVAKTGDYSYSSVQNAVNAAALAGESTVTLLKGTSEDVTISGAEITLDLAGNTLTLPSDCGVTIRGTDSKLTVTGDGAVTCDGTPFMVDAGALVIENGSVTSVNDYATYALNGGSITVNGGTLTSRDAVLTGNNLTGNMNFTVNGGTLTAQQGPAIYMPGQVELTITGGTLNGGVSLRMGQVNISGGTINAITKDIDSPSEYYNYSGNAWLPDALYVFGGTYTSKDSHGNSLNLNITGGTFNCANGQGSAVAIYDLGKVEQTMNITISGDAKLSTNATTRGAYDVMSLTDIGVTAPAAGYGTYSGHVNTAITGGYFTSDPSGYVPENYFVIAATEPGYTYAVTNEQPSADQKITVVDKTETTVPEGSALTEADKAKTFVDGVAEAVNTTKKTEIVSRSGADTSNANAKVEIEVKVKVSVTEENLIEGAGTMTFTAEPIAIVKVNNTQSGAEVKVNNSYLNGKPITVKLPLPANFTPEQIKHISSDGSTEYFLRTQKSGAKRFTIDDGCAVFTITKFSTFVLSGEVTYVEPSSSSGSSGYYVSTPSKTENGTVTVSPRYADKGDTVTVTVKPDSGYVLDDLTVTDKNGNKLTLTDKGNGKYTFVMPSGRVEVKASFAKEVETSPFADVATDAYYYEAVKWAVKNGITTGVGDNLFALGQPCTRAQIVTFLWRAAGSPEPKGTAAGMTDVVSGSYYEKAVAWAIENGVTTGTTATTFSPDATCTRAQAVTFLARALNAKAASAAEFSDVPTGSYFAEAVAWAAANGVTEGVGNGLFAPDNDCTRGQIVTFLYRAYNK